VSGELQIGDIVEDFEIQAPLGKGGMGVVYRARDLALNRPVALKVLLSTLSDDGRARTRFQKEIRAAVAVEHPSIVPVYRAGYDGTRFYIAMRCIDGPDLAVAMRSGGPMEEGRCMRILGMVASALFHVHQHGLIHRDVKPHNVLLWNAGEADEHPFLTDFGIAKALDDMSHLTGVGAIGTAAYMAPEVSCGASATAASDQYSLAVMAFEMLSGRLPFEGDSESVREAHMSVEPPALSQINPRISDPVSRAIAKALSKRAEGRHADIRGLIHAAEHSRRSFTESEQVSAIMARTEQTEQVVSHLFKTSMTDAAISEVTGVDRSQVMRLRRRRARETLLGG
jgi:serine/threonine-protein kinase